MSKRTNESVLSGGMMDSLIGKPSLGSNRKITPGYDNDTFGKFSNNLLGRNSLGVKEQSLGVPL